MELEILISALTNGNERIRAGAARNLGHRGDNRAVAPLLAALTDENARIRAGRPRGWVTWATSARWRPSSPL